MRVVTGFWVMCVLGVLPASAVKKTDVRVLARLEEGGLRVVLQKEKAVLASHLLHSGENFTHRGLQCYYGSTFLSLWQQEEQSRVSDSARTASISDQDSDAPFKSWDATSTIPLSCMGRLDVFRAKAPKVTSSVKANMVKITETEENTGTCEALLKQAAQNRINQKLSYKGPTKIVVDNKALGKKLTLEPATGKIEISEGKTKPDLRIKTFLTDGVLHVYTKRYKTRKSTTTLYEGKSDVSNGVHFFYSNGRLHISLLDYVPTSEDGPGEHDIAFFGRKRRVAIQSAVPFACTGEVEVLRGKGPSVTSNVVAKKVVIEETGPVQEADAAQKLLSLCQNNTIREKLSYTGPSAATLHNLALTQKIKLRVTTASLDNASAGSLWIKTQKDITGAGTIAGKDGITLDAGDNLGLKNAALHTGKDVFLRAAQNLSMTNDKGTVVQKTVHQTIQIFFQFCSFTHILSYTKKRLWRHRDFR